MLHYKQIKWKQDRKTEKQKQKSFFKSLAFIFDRDMIKTVKKKEVNKMDTFSTIVIVLSSMLIGYIIGNPDKFFK